MPNGRATAKPRSGRIGLKPLAGPLADTYWILTDGPHSTQLFTEADPKDYRIVIVTKTERKYGRAGHQQAFVEFIPAKFHIERKAGSLMKYTCSYDDFNTLYRVLEGEEFDDEMAMILLANA